MSRGKKYRSKMIDAQKARGKRERETDRLVRLVRQDREEPGSLRAKEQALVDAHHDKMTRQAARLETRKGRRAAGDV